MKISVVEPSIEYLDPPEELRRQLCLCATAAGISRGRRIDYDHKKPEELNKAGELLQRLLSKKPHPHSSVLEFGSMAVLITCSRICTHEIVRHRLASFLQESTRYVSYAKGATVEIIAPPDASRDDLQEYNTVMHDGELKIADAPNWVVDNFLAIRAYKDRIEEDGWKKESARYHLPHSLRARILVKTNFRHWRLIIAQRASAPAAPEMQMIFSRIKERMKYIHPVLTTRVPNEEVNAYREVLGSLENVLQEFSLTDGVWGRRGGGE